jgi:hypothetical protein
VTIRQAVAGRRARRGARAKPTTSIEGVVATVARERVQVTGFIRDGYEGEPTGSTTADGPPLNSCPGGP